MKQPNGLYCLNPDCRKPLYGAQKKYCKKKAVLGRGEVYCGNEFHNRKKMKGYHTFKDSAVLTHDPRGVVRLAERVPIHSVIGANHLNIKNGVRRILNWNPNCFDDNRQLTLNFYNKVQKIPIKVDPELVPLMADPETIIRAKRKIKEKR